MKIVNIFGLVVTVHVAVLLLIFAIPGCRSTTPSGTQVVAADDDPTVVPTPSPIQRVPELSEADLNPGIAPAERSSGFPAAAPVVGGGRYSPTRPADGRPSAKPPTAAPSAAPLQTYTVKRGDSLWAIAKKHGVTVRELAAANRLSTEANLQIDQKLLIPNKAGSNSAARPGAAAADEAMTTYVVRPGDTLGAIARRHQTSVGALKAMNNLRGDLVRVGDKLVIPRTEAPASTPAPPPAAAAPPSPPRPAAGAMMHTVVPGDTLGGIARRYGVKLGDLAMANQIADPRLIRVGQELVIPGWQDVAGPAGGKAPPGRSPSADQQRRPEPERADRRKVDSADDVPVIRVEEPEQTLRIQPAPDDAESGAPVFR